MNRFLKSLDDDVVEDLHRYFEEYIGEKGLQILEPLMSAKNSNNSMLLFLVLGYETSGMTDYPRGVVHFIKAGMRKFARSVAHRRKLACTTLDTSDYANKELLAIDAFTARLFGVSQQTIKQWGILMEHTAYTNADKNRVCMELQIMTHNGYATKYVFASKVVLL